MRTPHHRWLPAIFLAAVGGLFLFASCRQEKPAPIGETAADRLIINITSDGLYRLPLIDLQNSGLVLTDLSAENLQLTQNGTAVPYLLEDDALLFYGRAPDSRYTNSRPYLLQTGLPGELIPSADEASTSSPTAVTVTHTLTLEENSLYEAQALDATHTDPWFWHNIARGQKIDIPVEISTIGDGSGQLRLQLWGQTHSPEIENDHDLELFINGQPIVPIVWDGPVYHDPAIALPPGTLQAGENLITLSNEERGAALIDIMLLNWLALDVAAPPTANQGNLSFTAQEDTAVTMTDFSSEPIVLDIQDPAHPVRLTGAYADGDMTINVKTGMVVTAVSPTSFQSPHSLTPARQSNWRSPENQADLLIITTDELAPALAPLVEARETQGISVAIVPVAEIYDEFGGGEASPDSINRFVAHALENWQPPQPRYLFLVGEATTDYLGYASELPDNHVPSPLVTVGFSGETVSDSRLADINGDAQPEMAVGRWPVGTVQEVESLVARTLAYEQGTTVADPLFATDASEEQFADMAQSLWEGSGLADTAVSHLNGAPADELIAALNNHPWLLTYIGHGSLELWGKDSLFSTETIADLPDGQPPIVVQLTCLTGLFAQPGIESLAELMLQDENGPVLAVAATSLTLSSYQQPFAAALLQELVQTDSERIGDAFQHAKLALDIQDDGLREISDTFVLLGDPSALIVRP